MQDFTTPMMKQYMEIKKKYPDCLLFFRLGDFYELFLDDAKTGSEILGITLTGRPKGKDGRIPMAGVPYHAVDGYLNKLVKAGYKVAICEQLSEPDKKGIVERDVIRVVTPGTIMDERALEKKEHNYILALDRDGATLALTITDFSTGQLQTQEYLTDRWRELLRDELTRIQPSECILPPKLYNDPEVLKILKSVRGITIFLFHEWETASKYALKDLKEHFQVKTLKAFAIDTKPLAQKTCNALLSYLKQTQKSALPHIHTIVILPSDNFVSLDRATMMNLELFSTIRDREIDGSLLTAIDQTHTAMGGRLLKYWMVHPHRNKRRIEGRLLAVEELVGNSALSKKVDQILSEITDVERTFSRVSVGIGNARDLVSLKVSIEHVISLKHAIVTAQSKLLQRCQKNISGSLRNLVILIHESIQDDPPIHLKEGGILKDNIDSRLDELRLIIQRGKEWIAALEQTERDATGISTLKIRYNQVFGYFIEVSNSHLSSVPTHYFRKQTLVNGERFVTQALKEKEESILRAEDELKLREYELYKAIVGKGISYVEKIQEAAQAVAVIDCISSFAKTAKTRRYVKPVMIYGQQIDITQGRHPVVEQVLPSGHFVPNDTKLGNPKQSMMLLTGPNMAGKSVFLRQIALITLLSHIGSFVPAKKAYIPVVDAIFVRSGASDMITSGLSTFMVEMVETAYILNHATSKSLIIMDEIGRGTSTHDGVSIAWAVAEYLIQNITPPPKTLFATHYHELIELADKYPTKITNAHMQVTQTKKEPVFSHILKAGPAYESYGVQVAKLAGVPEEVVTRATELLGSFTEKSHLTDYNHQSHIIQKLKSLQMNEITPLQALTVLSELQAETLEN